MKYFLKKVIAFTFSLILLLVIIQTIISLRIKGKTVRGHDNLEQTSNVNADLVFIGSSRCWAHFNPKYFDSTYRLKSENIGVDGHSEISMAITRLNDYLSRNKDPEYVVLTFDPFVSAGSLTQNENFVHKNDFARYAFLPKRKDLPIVNYFGFNFYEKYIPLYAIFKYKLLSDAISLKNVDNWARYGYSMHDEKWDTLAKPVTNVLRNSFFKIPEVPSIEYSLLYLKRLCLKRNIKLLCIQTPVYKVIQDDSIFLETKKICKRLDIPFIDANKEYIRNNIGYFYNSNHLNKWGVDQLNLFLKSDSTFSAFLKK